MSPDSNTLRQFEAPDLKALSYRDQVALDNALRDGWRLTPATLASKISNGRWIAARHLLHISTIVATEVAKGGARIILTMPFRHGKTQFLSVWTAIWFLEKWAEKYVMNVTYGLDLATDASLQVRETFQDPTNHHLLKTRISKKKQRVDRFLTTGGGGLTAAGIGGPITGRGGDIILLDDYTKNAEEAMSPAHHRKTFEWFRSTLYTRLEPYASLLILATRWGQRDLIGLALTELAHENWILINLPMHAMINDPLGREEGEVLWKERYNEKACANIKKTLGKYWYMAQCQQDPLASMSGADLGDQIKIIPESEVPPITQLRTLRIWDLAGTQDGGDWTAGLKMARHKDTGKIYLLDMQRKQYSSGKVKKLVKACAETDGHGVSIWMEQEPGSSGKTVIKDYSTLLKGYSFKGEKATGPLEVRASPMAAFAETNKLFMVEADWNQDLIDELNAFGEDMEHDDQIVVLALGYNKLVVHVTGALTWGRDEPTTAKNVIPIRRRITDEDTPIYKLTW